jgi:hypothetical protein
MENNKSSNPFVSYSSKPDYFQNYKFDHFCFKIYDDVEPQINSRYPTSLYDAVVYQDNEIFMDITIYSIHLTKDDYSPLEMIWMVKSKSDNKLFKPVYKDDEHFCFWLDLIYSWVQPENIDLMTISTSIPNDMIPINSTLTDYYITRKIYLEQDPDTPHLKMWGGKTHYMEWIGGPEPPPTCACCGQTRVTKPSEDELINSTETNFDIKQKDFGLKFNSNHLKLYLNNGSQIPTSIDYYPNENKIYLTWNHWTYPDNLSSFYATFYKGKFFEKQKPGYNRLKYYYPEWVQDNTIWYASAGGEYGSDMFPELSKNESDNDELIMNELNKNKSIKDYSNHLYYTNYATNSVDLTSNKFVNELFDLANDLWNEIKQFIPDDIKGNIFEVANSDEKSKNIFDINKTIKYSGLEDLDLLRIDLIEYFNQLDHDDSIKILVDRIKKFTPHTIPELSDKIYVNTPIINELTDKYSQLVVDSPDVLVYCQCDYPEKKIWIGKTIVNGILVKIIKEVQIQNEEIIQAKKNNNGKIFINGMEQVEQPIEESTSIILETGEEADQIAYDLIEDLVKKTWPNKNIIKYDKEDSQMTQSKYQKKEQSDNFKILSYTKEKKNIN